MNIINIIKLKLFNLLNKKNIYNLPKVVLYKILANVDIKLLFLLSKRIKRVKEIMNTSYFWCCKLKIDYRQFNHENYDNYLERYKRLYVGKATTYQKFIDIPGIKDILILDEGNLDDITSILLETLSKDYGVNIIRGDIITISNILYLERSLKVIFDGKKLIPIKGTVPIEFKLLYEFPIAYWNYYCHIIDKSLFNINFKDVKFNGKYIYCPVHVNDVVYYIVSDQYGSNYIDNIIGSDDQKEKYYQSLFKKKYNSTHHIGTEVFLPLPPLTMSNTLMLLCSERDAIEQTH